MRSIYDRKRYKQERFTELISSIQAAMDVQLIHVNTLVHWNDFNLERFSLPTRIFRQIIQHANKK